MGQEAGQRDLTFLKECFIREVGCDTNDVVTLFSYWQSNFGKPPADLSPGRDIKIEDTRGSFDNKTSADASGPNQTRKTTLLFPRGLEASS